MHGNGLIRGETRARSKRGTNNGLPSLPPLAAIDVPKAAARGY